LSLSSRMSLIRFAYNASRLHFVDHVTHLHRPFSIAYTLYIV
jgi:hypothetical protein